VYYSIDTFGGQSGAPVWLKTEAGPRVVAIHAYGAGGSIAGVEANSGPRITETVLRRIEEWVSQ
jgi:glutamyl endopeptidase